MTSHAHCVSIFWAEMPREGASLGAQTLVDNCQFLQAEKMLGSVSPREVLPSGLASRWIRSRRLRSATTGLALTDDASS